MCTAPGICPVSYSKISSFDSTIRIPSSFRCFSSQSVSTSASGCAYCVGCVAITKEIHSALSPKQQNLVWRWAELTRWIDHAVLDHGVDFGSVLSVIERI